MRFGWLTIALGLLMTFAAASTLEAELLQHTNAQRQLAGLTLLKSDEALSVAAQAHAVEMAELGYLAHESPRDHNRTLSMRLDAAGAIVQAAGENLALLSNVPDVATGAVSGWMDSPGHRANLLGNFTHVGFGAAGNSAGDTWVVQVLGRKDVLIGDVSVEVFTERVLKLDIAFVLSDAREVAFWFGTEVSVPGDYPPGAHLYGAELSNPQLLHLNSGTRPLHAGEAEPFISADGGWFDPNSGWSPSGGMQSGILRIDAVTGLWADVERLRATIRFERDPGGEPGAWLDGQWVADAAWNGRDFTVILPVSALGGELQIGLQEAGSATYRIAAVFAAKPGPAGQPVLEVRNP